MKQKWKQVLGSGVLLLIMVLSVVGFSYTPDSTHSAGAPSDSRDEVVFDGRTFTYDPSVGMYVTTVQGQQVYARNAPGDVERMGFSLPLPVQTVFVDVPSGASEQQRFVRGRLVQDLSSRLPISVRQGSGDCSNSSSLTVSIQGDEDLNQMEGSCYETGITDASILLLADYMVYAFYGIL